MRTEAIDRAREQIDAAWVRGDADGITRYLAEDAILMPPHDAKKVGRQQINSWLRQFFQHFSMTELAMPERQVIASGDWAFEVTLYEWTLVPKAGGQAVRDQANWVGIWRRGRDGSWLETQGIWNSTLPLSGTQ